MARSSHGPRRTIPWVAQKPRPVPRVVRLGRAANDNAGGSGLRARLVISLIAVLSAIVLASWLL